MSEASSVGVPEVSVIIPVYNGADYITEAIRSVLSQTAVSFEVIVGDNCSTDATVMIVRKLSDPRVRLIEGTSNFGIYGNLQRLFAIAKAPLVKILCADDWLLPGGLHRQVRFMQDNPELAFSRCLGAGDLEFYATHFKYRYELKLPSKIYPPGGILAFAIYGCICGNLSRTIVRPKVVGNELKFDLSLPYAGDYEFWARVAETAPFGMQNEECVYVRAHLKQSTRLLNQKNELVSQTDELLTRFSQKIDQSLIPLFRWHWAIDFVSQQWHKGFECLQAGSWQGIWAVMPRKKYTFGFLLTFAIYILSINGRLGRRFTTSRLTVSLLNSQKGHRNMVSVGHDRLPS